METNLFGDPEVGMVKATPKVSKKEKFLDYDGFVEKFKPRKTTDDCYTPPELYEIVKVWVDKNIIPLNGLRVLRPFYPGGDYQNEVYLPGDIVIDNPPFSILAQIRRYYSNRGIRYFLFAPSLTLFSSLQSERECFIVSHADITYENKALIKTSFITNCVNDGTRIWVAGDLSRMLTKKNKELQKAAATELPVYSYPDEVLSAAIEGKIAARGISYKVHRDECRPIERLDSQAASGKSIFGKGFLLSEQATRRKKDAAKVEAKVEAKVIKWELSEREKHIIQRMNKPRQDQ